MREHAVFLVHRESACLRMAAQWLGSTGSISLTMPCSRRLKLLRNSRLAIRASRSCADSADRERNSSRMAYCRSGAWSENRLIALRTDSCWLAGSSCRRLYKLRSVCRCSGGSRLNRCKRSCNFCRCPGGRRSSARCCCSGDIRSNSSMGVFSPAPRSERVPGGRRARAAGLARSAMAITASTLRFRTNMRSLNCRAELVQQIHVVERVLHLLNLQRRLRRLRMGRTRAIGLWHQNDSCKCHARRQRNKGAPQPPAALLPGVDSLEQPTVKIRRDRQIAPLSIIQRLPHGFLRGRYFATGVAGIDMPLKLGGNVGIQSSGAVSDDQLRARVAFQWASHATLPPPRVTPCAPIALAALRRPETAATSRPLPNNRSHWRSARIPSLRICASSPRLAAWPADTESPAAPPAASPGTATLVPLSCAGLAPACWCRPPSLYPNSSATSHCARPGSSSAPDASRCETATL